MKKRLRITHYILFPLVKTCCAKRNSVKKGEQKNTFFLFSETKKVLSSHFRYLLKSLKVVQRKYVCIDIYRYIEYCDHKNWSKSNTERINTKETIFKQTSQNWIHIQSIWCELFGTPEETKQDREHSVDPTLKNESITRYTHSEELSANFCVTIMLICIS